VTDEVGSADVQVVEEPDHVVRHGDAETRRVCELGAPAESALVERDDMLVATE